MPLTCFLKEMYISYSGKINKQTNNNLKWIWEFQNAELNM